MASFIMEYSVIRTNRKTMALEITRDANVLVRAPRFASEAAVSAFVQNNSAWIEKHVAKRKERMSELPAALDEAALRKKARELLPGRVEHYAAIMGVRPTGISITSAKNDLEAAAAKTGCVFRCI